MNKLKLKIVERGRYYRKGELFLNDRYLCYTLEDTDRWLYQSDLITDIQSAKIDKVTAIPYGTYPVVLLFSPKFKCIVPMVKNVPGFENIEIHCGNNVSDTEGCVLVGTTTITGLGLVSYSQLAFRVLMSNLMNLRDKEIELTIVE